MKGEYRVGTVFKTEKEKDRVLSLFNNIKHVSGIKFNAEVMAKALEFFYNNLKKGENNIKKD